MDREWAEAFVSQVDPERLAGLEVVDIRFPDAEFEDDPRYLENAAERASIYGADELTERLALISFEDQLYDVGFTLLRYGDDWKVLSQVSPLGGMSALGTARPTTAEDFELRTSGSSRPEARIDLGRDERERLDQVLDRGQWWIEGIGCRRVQRLRALPEIGIPASRDAPRLLLAGPAAGTSRPRR